MGERVEAWHFLPDDGLTRYKPRLRVEVGQTLTVDPDRIELCKYGLHASRDAMDALRYAPGALVCRVLLSGQIVEGDDKLVASERTVLWMADATRTLHEFACSCATRALERERKAGREPDPRSWAAIQAKRDWLAGSISADDLDAARYAADSAAGYAAWHAAGSAAEYAARYAAGYAAWFAAGSAAWFAARSAEREWQSRELGRMLSELNRGI